MPPHYNFMSQKQLIDVSSGKIFHQLEDDYSSLESVKD